MKKFIDICNEYGVIILLAFTLILLVFQTASPNAHASQFKRTEYKVVCIDWEEYPDSKMTSKMKIMIDAGWEPQGGVSISCVNTFKCMACQAVMKEY